MTELLYIIIGTFIISLGSLVGVLTLSMNKDFLQKILLNMVGLSSGALLGVAFIHLLPEGIKKMDGGNFFLIVLGTIMAYLLIEKLLHWRHCHAGPDCHVHSLGYMNLVGDSVHNFIDGLIIASAFMANPALGVTTVFAMALHEIPQEIGDFSVLLYAGFEKKRALLLNFLVALTVVLGGIVGWILSASIPDVTKYLTPIAVGGFIYISLSDILPEIRKETNIKHFLSSFSFIIIGIAMMLLLKD